MPSVPEPARPDEQLDDVEQEPERRGGLYGPVKGRRVRGGGER